MFSRIQTATIKTLACVLGIATFTTCLAVTGIHAQAISSKPSLSVFDVPLGATLEDIRALAKKRGHTMVPEKTYVEQYAVINEFKETRFLTLVSSSNSTTERKEAFAFIMTGPPNTPKAWAGGSYLKYGDGYSPAPSAPMRQDVVSALQNRYGPYSFYNKVTGTYGWFWDGSGKLITGPNTKLADCSGAIAQIQSPGAPGISYSITNASVGKGTTVRNAAKYGCAYGVQLEISDVRGATYIMRFRVADFKAGYESLAITTKFVNELTQKSNQQRSQQNKPEF